MRQQQASTCSSGPENASLPMIQFSAERYAASGRSDVDDDLGQPAVRRLLHLQPVVRDRLHLVTQLVPFAVQRLAPRLAVQSPFRDPHLETAEQQMLGVEVVEQRLQPVEQEIVTLLGRK